MINDLDKQAIPPQDDLTLLSWRKGFPLTSVGKASTCSAADLSSIPGSGRSPGDGNGNPFQYSCLEKSHGQRLRSMGLQELDLTQRLNHYCQLKVGWAESRASTVAQILHQGTKVEEALAVSHLWTSQWKTPGNTNLTVSITTHGFQQIIQWFSEKAMAPHSSTLAWKIPWTEEPDRLQSMGLLRVGHD